MSELQEVFNNREIAVGIWMLFVAVIAIFTKPFRQFLKSIFSIAFCRKFVVLYIVFLCYFCSMIYGLYSIGFWNVSLLKDTVFWVLFVEFPLFVKTIEKAKDSHFFSQLIKGNIALTVVFEFILNFWTFGLITEIVIVPCSALIGVLYAVSSSENKHQQAKHFLGWLFVIFGVVVIVNTAMHIIQTPNEIISVSALKELTLPLLLLTLNLPVVYALALYNMYEQVFVHVKGTISEKLKIKRRIFRFAGIYLSRITAVRYHSAQTIVISLTEKDMKYNLEKLEKCLSIQVGENYMKRARFYVFWYSIGMLACLIGIILCNSYVPLKEVLAFNFAFDIPRIKEITTYICSTGIVVLFCSFIYSIGLLKKKNEEISQVKKYSLYNLLYLIKRQHSLLQEFPPIDEPKEIFILYITTAYELKLECDKAIALFENLFAKWEFDLIKQLQLAIFTLINDIGIDEDEIKQYTPDNFNSYFMDKKSEAPQNEKINVFTHDVQKGIKRYTEQIKLCFEGFEKYM